MYTLVDMSTSPVTNKSINIRDIIHFDGGPAHKVVSVLATGTFTGTPKLTISQDGTNFAPLLNDDDDQIELEAEKMVFLDWANIYLKVDLTGVTSSDLKVTIQ